MSRKVILETNFRLFAGMLFLFGVAGTAGITISDNDKIPWIVTAIFVLMALGGLRMFFKDTTHQIFIEGNELGWVVNAKEAKRVDLTNIQMIEIRSYPDKAGKNTSWSNIIVLIDKNEFEDMIPQNCTINSTAKKIKKSFQQLHTSHPGVSVSTKEFAENPGIRKYIDWNNPSSRDDWEVHLQPNPTGRYYDCELEVEFLRSGQMQLELEIKDQGFEMAGPIDIYAGRDKLISLDLERSNIINLKKNIDITSLPRQFQAGELFIVKDSLGHEWSGPLMYYS